jgi:hypothetical protein
VSIEFSEDIASFVNQEFNRRVSERKAFENQWRLNNEFINGNQYMDINTVTNSLEEIPKLYWYQEREVFNQLATILETRVSRLTRQRPIPKVRPNSQNDDDIAKAKISNLVIGNAWNDQNMTRLYQDMVSWLETTGTVLIKTLWDANKGRVIAEGEDLLTEDEQRYRNEVKDVIDTTTLADITGEDKEKIVLREGEVSTVIVPPFEFYPDSSFHSDLNECRSVIHAKAYHIDEIYELWNIKVESEDIELASFHRSSTGGLGNLQSMKKYQPNQVKNYAIVKEYYERPCRRYPQGRYIVVAGKKTLYVGTLPYKIGIDGEFEFPFVKIASIYSVGCFWGKSVIERCIPIQRRYNALRNRKAEYLNLVAIGQWYEPIGSVDDDMVLSNAPAEVIRYTAINGQRPEPVTFPNLPSSFENELANLMQEFTSVSGVSELARFSDAPSGVSSGVALSITNEQDDSRIGMTAMRIAVGTTEIIKYWLRLYRQFVQEPRLLKNVGNELRIEIKEWLASDLKSDDIIIENASALSETPAQRRQMVFDLINTGVFHREEQNPFTSETRQKLLQMLEFGNWESSILEDIERHRSRAKRENYQITKENAMPPLKPFDDHQLHIEEHQRMMLSAEYEELLKSPMGAIVDRMMNIHISLHEVEVAKIRQQQFEEQLFMQRASEQQIASADAEGKIMQMEAQQQLQPKKDKQGDKNDN